MRFVIAYLIVFVLGIFFVIGLESLLFNSSPEKLIFLAILFTAPLIFVGATIAEIYYGFSKKANWRSFLYFGFLYGLFATVVITGIAQPKETPIVFILFISILGGLISSLLALIFFYFRGGKTRSGRGAINE